jgi:hypothetical protein
MDIGEQNTGSERRPIPLLTRRTENGDGIVLLSDGANSRGSIVAICSFRA